MCLAVPALIKTVDDKGMAQVDMGGVSLEVSLALTPEAEVGDYVIVHTGYAISTMDEEEAQETLRLFDEIEASYQQELAEQEAAQQELTRGGEGA